jgi:hypothetical protein
MKTEDSIKGKSIRLIPEHIIVSCDIAADGYRAVTLRSVPNKIGGPFQFMTVMGGLQAHPWLNTWPNWWEIEGVAFTKKLVNTYNFAYEETFFRITGHRKLNALETVTHRKQVEKYWEDFNYGDNEDDKEKL